MSRHFIKPSNRAPRKAHTDYPVGLAFSRIEFYLDVLEAHFAALGVGLTQAKERGNATMPNPAREEKTKRSAP